MAYRLSIADELPTSVRACAREQLQGAIDQLDGGGGDDPATAIHEARKHLKKLRALLRLVRPALGEETYRRENDALRDAARQLSATRDADVLVATVEALARDAAGQLPASDFAALRDALAAEAAARRAQPAAATGDAEATATAVALELRDALARVEEWPLADSDWETVVASVTRAYARGRRDGRRAAELPTVEALHQWRKRVKDLWYHHRLLKPVWPDVISAYGEEAHVLSELLGDDHDLAVLRDRLVAGVALPPGAAADLTALLGLVDERRARLQADARRLGTRLYAESPKAFERRWRRWVEAAVADAGEEQPA
ncbi:CHAD domain-containing protein [Conexibacter woesei]|uniref:CHAD domain containing protein n=1 Tax=Conexibacter woesei (strain DSM 14684 / CCUG 47730 / CIP 108061 / JCM 11494 / NBRC 100937 / ID131577) TaxID=469383 RepID=D3F148_CONWI|nr:CHAD domain-containing protein [Conexibacter woesei]ADB50124.1 CHAD domain containing protein [Conexibacter woesei DSM 14684]